MKRVSSLFPLLAGTCGLSEEDALAKYPNVDVYLDGDDFEFDAEYFHFTDSKVRCASVKRTSG